MGMKIPGVYVEIKGDMAQLKKDMTTARQYVTEQSTSMSNAINNALSGQQVKSKTNTLVKNLNSLNSASKLTSNSFKTLGVDLKDMQKVTGLADKQFASLQSRMLKNQAETAQQRALVGIAKSANLTKKEIKSLGTQFGLTKGQIKKVTTQLDKSKSSLQNTNKLFATMGRNIVAMGSVWLGAQGLGALKRVTDEYTVIDSKLKLVTDSSEEFTAVYERLYDISQKTGSSFALNAKTYTNLALALQDTNIPSSELLQVFEDINKSLVVAGASVQETQSFLLQFKQALGANRLAGDEFKGMMEANSYWAGKFAKALGTDINGLYEMKEAGELTTQKVLGAHKKMTEGIEKDWLGIEKTIERASYEWVNAWEDIIHDTNKSAEGTKNVATAISELATTAHENKKEIVSLFTGIIEVSGFAVKGIGEVVDAWKHLYNMSDAQAKGHSLDKIFGMSAGDLDSMLNATEKYAVKLSGLKGQIGGVRAEINKLYEKRDRTGLTENEEKTIDVYRRQIEQLESMVRITQERGKAEKETASAIDGALKEYFSDTDKRAEDEESVTASVAGESLKRIRIKTDERTQLLEMSKQDAEDRSKILDDEVAENLKAAQKITDVWEIQADDRYAVQSRGIDAMIAADIEANETRAAFVKEFTGIANAATGDIVSAFVAGEDTKVAVAGIASSYLEQYAVDAATKGLEPIFEAIGGQIGAWVGLGTAQTSTEGETWQEKLGTGAAYLGAAGAAIIGAKAIGNSMYAQGGWLGQNPGGGVVSGGPAGVDTVFGGYTDGGQTRNWINNGEYVIDAETAAHNMDLLEFMRGQKKQIKLADGGPVGDAHKTTSDINASIFDTFWMEVLSSGGNFYSSAIQAGTYGVGTLGGMMGGKELGKNMFADGGHVTDKKFGLGGWLTNPLGELTGGSISTSSLLNPAGDLLGNLFGDTIGTILAPGVNDISFSKLYELLRQMPEGKYIADSLDASLYPFVESVLTPGEWPNEKTAEASIKGALDSLADSVAEYASGFNILDSFETGTDYVPQTGPYMLHQGEKVVTAAENSKPETIEIHGDGAAAFLDKINAQDQSLLTNNNSSSGFESLAIAVLEKIYKAIEESGSTTVEINGKTLATVFDSYLVKKAKSGIPMGKRVYI